MDDRRNFDRAIPAGASGRARGEAEQLCIEAARSRSVAAAAATAAQAATRAARQAEAEADEALAAASRRTRAEAKAHARNTYHRQLARAVDALERQRATAAWMSEIDRINRESRAAERVLELAQSRVMDLRQAGDEAEQAALAERIRAETAHRACLEARGRVAMAAEQGAAAGDDRPRRPAAGGDDAREMHPGRDSSVGWAHDSKEIALSAVPGVDVALPTSDGRLVAEYVFEGDRATLALVAQRLSDITGGTASHFLLLLHELVEDVADIASRRGFLAFNRDHPLWSQFGVDECRTIVTALSNLGFRIDPDGGWTNSRAPATADLAMALSYAGYDRRAVRWLSTPGNTTRDLAGSLAISPLDCLANLAPDLTVGQLIELLGPPADSLGELWDEWGHLRPLLLSTHDALAAG